ncbi:hypothetical protein Pth03_82360 [Planotetraspora thailandica]|uniref:Uncharacterized protein n=1 Tax=Planotetraspora thailandica TaxID=487172 RepID=A0A8J3Y358_9ACTN|nr:hypothetical protein [Planotetraspora thailandica]GII59847.1 hypothetical protein Pth03_82360 [Planotetraspora thailandica]
MNLRNVFAKVGMTVAAGAVVLTATPSAIAGTAPTPTPAQPAVKALTLPDWDLGDDHCDDVTIKSKAGNRFVSAEVDYTGYVSGMLRARATSAGDWEKFSICPGNGFYTLYSYSAKGWVTAEQNYTGADAGMLRARAGSVGAWEKFEVQRTSDYFTLKSLANGKYVSAELAYTGTGYGMLRARSTSVGDWEKFQIS